MQKSDQLVNCPDCDRGRERIDCWGCQGMGSVTCPVCYQGEVKAYDAFNAPFVRCPKCHGDYNGVTCRDCGGSGDKFDTCSTCKGIGKLTFSVAENLLRKREEQEKLRQAELQRRETERQRKAEEAKRKWEAETPLREAAERKRNEDEQKRKVEEEQKKEKERKKWRNADRKKKVVAFSSDLFTHLGTLCLWGIGIWVVISGVRCVNSDSNRSLQSTTTANSNAGLLTEADLAGKSKSELDIMRNVPFARHGLKFGKSRKDISSYFERQSWYKPDTSNPEVVYNRLSLIEKKNVVFIREYQKRHGMLR